MRRSRVLSLAGVFVAVGLLWGLAAWALERHGRAARADGAWDAIVVAGCRVEPDGQPSLALQRRTRAAVDLWRQGLGQRVVFTGGTGRFPPAEAVAAAALARALGLPDEVIVVEDRSHSTEDNARRAAGALRAAGLPANRVLVVTDTYHAWRAERVFRRYFPEVGTVGTTSSAAVRSRGALREVLAVAWYGLNGRLG